MGSLARHGAQVALTIDLKCYGVVTLLLHRPLLMRKGLSQQLAPAREPWYSTASMNHTNQRSKFLPVVLGFILALFQWSLAAGTETPFNSAWKILQAGTEDKSSVKRSQALTALGLLAGDRRAAETAERALGDASSEVRVAAVNALGDMNAKGSIPKIKNILNVSDARTVVAIAAVLKKFNDPEAYEIYYEILTGERKAGGGILSGLKDKKSLEKMGFQEAIGFIPFGGVGLGAYNYFKQNSTANVDVAAAVALADDPDPASETALVKASFEGKEVVQVAALRALARRGDPKVTSDISPAMYSDHSIISYTAAAVVIHLTSLRTTHPAKHQSASR